MRSHESFSDSSIFTSHHFLTIVPSGTRDSKAGVEKSSKGGGREVAMSAVVPEGKIFLKPLAEYKKPLAETRGQKAQLWVFIGGFEQAQATVYQVMTLALHMPFPKRHGMM